MQKMDDFGTLLECVRLADLEHKRTGLPHGVRRFGHLWSVEPSQKVQTMYAYTSDFGWEVHNVTIKR